MVDNLTDIINREWNSTNSDNNNVNNKVNTNHSSHRHLLSWKIYDNSNNHNSTHNNNQNQRQHQHQYRHQNQHQHVHQQSVQSPLIITTTDYINSSPLPRTSVLTTFSNHQTVNSGHVTDEEIGTSVSILSLSSKNRPFRKKHQNKFLLKKDAANFPLSEYI